MDQSLSSNLRSRFFFFLSFFFFLFFIPFNRLFFQLVQLSYFRLLSHREFAVFFRFVSLETRLKAEADAATAAGGMEVMLDLKDKMGMIVNPGKTPKIISRPNSNTYHSIFFHSLLIVDINLHQKAYGLLCL